MYAFVNKENKTSKRLSTRCQKVPWEGVKVNFSYYYITKKLENQKDSAMGRHKIFLSKGKKR